MIDITLPEPTEHELSKWNKADYFIRIYTEYINIKENNKIDSAAFASWIHSTYESWMHYNKPLTYTQFKKTL